MAVLRIVPNLHASDPAAAQAFYGDILGLNCAMDQGWIRTYVAGAPSPPQISIASEGGSGTPLPALWIEVDDFDATMDRAKHSGHLPTYGPIDEPWGVLRAYLTDPFGNTVNILCHI